MNIDREIDMFIRGKRAGLKEQFNDWKTLSNADLSLLLQIETYYLLKNINNIIEQEAINKGNFPR